MGRAPSPSYDLMEQIDLTWAANYSVLGNTYGYAAHAGSATGEFELNPYSNRQFLYKTPVWCH